MMSKCRTWRVWLDKTLTPNDRCVPVPRMVQAIPRSWSKFQGRKERSYAGWEYKWIFQLHLFTTILYLCTYYVFVFFRISIEKYIHSTLSIVSLTKDFDFCDSFFYSLCNILCTSFLQSLCHIFLCSKVLPAQLIEVSAIINLATILRNGNSKSRCYSFLYHCSSILWSNLGTRSRLQLCPRTGYREGVDFKKDWIKTFEF